MQKSGSIDSIECPVCLEIPSAEIFQCKNGHSICHVCVSKLRECPSCRAPYSEGCIRNRALETLLDLMNFECPNKELGCKESVRRQNLHIHQLACPFHPEAISICKQILNNCNFFAHPNNVADTVQHLLNEHGFIHLPLKKRLGEIHLRRFRESVHLNNFQRDNEYIWNPVIISQTRASTTLEEVNATFLLFFDITFINNNDFMFSWHCYKLGSKNENRYELEICIKTQNKNAGPKPIVDDILWKVPALNLHQMKNGILRNPLKIEVKSLLKDYINKALDDTLVINVALKFLGKAPRKPKVGNQQAYVAEISPFAKTMWSSKIEDKLITVKHASTQTTTISKDYQHHTKISRDMHMKQTGKGFHYHKFIVIILAGFILMLQLMFLYYWIFPAYEECPLCPDCVQEDEPVSMYNCMMNCWKWLELAYLNVIDKLQGQSEAETCTKSLFNNC